MDERIFSSVYRLCYTPGSTDGSLWTNKYWNLVWFINGRVLNSKTKKMYCVFMQELNIFALHLDKWLLPFKVSLEDYLQIWPINFEIQIKSENQASTDCKYRRKLKVKLEFKTRSKDDGKFWYIEPICNIWYVSYVMNSWNVT